MNTIEQVEARIAVESLLKHLTRKQANIIAMRMRGDTLEEAAAHMHLSRDRIRQIEIATHRKMRLVLERMHVDPRVQPDIHAFIKRRRELIVTPVLQNRNLFTFAVSGMSGTGRFVSKKECGGEFWVETIDKSDRPGVIMRGHALHLRDGEFKRWGFE